MEPILDEVHLTAGRPTRKCLQSWQCSHQWAPALCGTRSYLQNWLARLRPVDTIQCSNLYLHLLLGLGGCLGYPQAGPRALVSHLA